jgi:hypothetical protein
MPKPEREKVGVDLDELLGGGASDMSAGDVTEEPAEDDGEDSLPPGFDAAADEFLDASLPSEERKAALHRAIKACGGEY